MSLADVAVAKLEPFGDQSTKSSEDVGKGAANVNMKTDN